MDQETKEIGRGIGEQYDAVTIEPNMPVHQLIFLLSKSLEASSGRAKIVSFVSLEGPEDKNNRLQLCILVHQGSMRVLEGVCGSD